MYNNYFGLSDAPFENNLDQRFLYFSANHRDVAAALLHFIKWKKSFALVCGDTGTGKTLLIHYLLSRLPDDVHPILTADPDASFMEILQAVAGILKIADPGQCEPELDIDQMKPALTAACGQGKRFVVIVDDAHLFSDWGFEQIRLLSNVETPKHKLFQILFVGHCALSDRLIGPEMRQLRQRIAINRVLAPMDAAETLLYVDHRLKMVGGSFDACFEPDCRDPVFKMTWGVPSNINRLCDISLRACMSEKLPKVNLEILKKAGADLRSDAFFTPGTHAGSGASSGNSVRLLAVFTTSVVIWALIGIYGYQGGLGEGVQTFLLSLDPAMSTTPAAVHQPVSETVAEPELPAADITSPESGTGAPLSELRQTLQPRTPGSPGEKPRTEDISPLLPVMDFQQTALDLLLHKPKRLVVKPGDTLSGIAARFFPENTSEGVKKILAANRLTEMNRIYVGQKLIIPVN